MRSSSRRASVRHVISPGVRPCAASTTPAASAGAGPARATLSVPPATSTAKVRTNGSVLEIRGMADKPGSASPREPWPTCQWPSADGLGQTELDQRTRRPSARRAHTRRCMSQHISAVPYESSNDLESGLATVEDWIVDGLPEWNNLLLDDDASIDAFAEDL